MLSGYGILLSQVKSSFVMFLSSVFRHVSWDGCVLAVNDTKNCFVSTLREFIYRHWIDRRVTGLWWSSYIFKDGLYNILWLVCGLLSQCLVIQEITTTHCTAIFRSLKRCLIGFKSVAGQLKDIQILVPKPLLCCLGCVLRVVILLEGEPSHSLRSWVLWRRFS